MKLIGSKWVILRLLNQRNSIPVEELKQSTELSLTTLREHLEDLEKRGLVDYEKQAQGRGRPKHKYFLTDRARSLFPEPDDSLAKILFKVLRKSLEPGDLNQILRDTLIEFLHSTNQEIMSILDDHEVEIQSDNEEVSSVPS